MIRYGNQQEVEEYFNHAGVNQSFLKALLGGVEYTKQDEKALYYEEKGHFIIGSGVDVQITQGKEAFDNTYYYSSSVKPSSTVMSIVQKVFDDFNLTDMVIPEARLGDLTDFILQSCEHHNYQNRWTEATKVNKIIEQGSDYYQELVESSGKQILSEIESNIISNIVMSFKSHPHTAKYFKDDGFDILYQVPIYFTYRDVECKALLDMVLINRNKKIIQPIDLKTIGDSIRKFPKAVKDRGYNIQAAFYVEALRALMNNNGYSIPELGDISGYKIAPFKFIVETTSYKTNKLTGQTTYYQGKPLVFTLSSEQMMLGKYGRPELGVLATDRFLGESVHWIKYQEITGFEHAIKLYKWHEENGYEYDKDVKESGGDLII